MTTDIDPASNLAKLMQLESSKIFQGAVISIIVISALAIGAKTYDLSPVVEQGLIVLDRGVTLFFLAEILLRFAVSTNKKRFFLDGWNVFDTIVVIGSLVPIANAEAVLMGRLLRVFRVLRLVSVVPELRQLGLPPTYPTNLRLNLLECRHPAQNESGTRCNNTLRGTMGGQIWVK